MTIETRSERNSHTVCTGRRFMYNCQRLTGSNEKNSTAHGVVLAIGNMRWINDTAVSYFPYAVSLVACYRHTMRHAFLTHMLDASQQNHHSTCTHTLAFHYIPRQRNALLVENHSDYSKAKL